MGHRTPSRSGRHRRGSKSDHRIAVNIGGAKRRVAAGSARGAAKGITVAEAEMLIPRAGG